MGRHALSFGIVAALIILAGTFACIWARARGLTRMEGLVLSSNATMLHFAHALGFEATLSPEELTTMRIVKRLRPGPQRK